MGEAMSDENQKRAEEELKAIGRSFREGLASYRKTYGKVPDFVIDGPRVPINPQLVTDAKLYAERNQIIDSLPKGAVCVEVGVQRGTFSHAIFNRCKPKKLHLIDLKLDQMTVKYPPEEVGTRVHFHEGKSWEVMETFPDDYFDWVYIDGAHNYASVKKDLIQACRTVKRGGYVICNDYMTWSTSEGYPYGVLPAVNECVNAMNWPVKALSLHQSGNFDIAFQRPI